MTDGDRFLLQCRENYFLGLRPSGLAAKEQAGYVELLEIARRYFDSSLHEEFAQFLMEGQYFVQLWAAHLIVEYGDPNEDLLWKCIEQIRKYADSSVFLEAASEEREWLFDRKLL